MNKRIPPLLLSICLALFPGGAKGAITLSDPESLNLPFERFGNPAHSGKYQSTTDWQHADTFFRPRKQAIVTQCMDQAMAYFGAGPTDMGYNILEIGTGQGYLTSRMARHIYNKRVVETASDYLGGDGVVVNPYTASGYGGTVVITIDNWQGRDGETIATHSITIPTRIPVGDSTPPLPGELSPETVVPQMLSNLIHEGVRVAGGATDADSVNAFLDMIQIPIKDYGTVTADAYLNVADAAPFYDPVANENDLLALRAGYNSGENFAMVVIDTDTRNTYDFANMLLRTYNTLPIGGVMVMDDLHWFHQDDGESSAAMKLGFNLFLNAVRDELFDNGGTPAANLPDFSGGSPSPFHHVLYDENGNPLNLTDYSGDVLMSSETYGGVSLPMFEYHHVWAMGIPWMVVFRKVSVGGDLGTIPAEYTGGTLTP